MREHFSDRAIAVIVDSNTSQYPERIQNIIRKIRMYFHNNDSTSGIRNMMNEIEEFLYQRALEGGVDNSLKHWWIINEYQPEGNLTSVELNYRGVMQ